MERIGRIVLLACSCVFPALLPGQEWRGFAWLSVLVGNGPQSVATGDFNGDGIADLVATNHHSDNVGVVLANGSGGVWSGSFAAVVYYGVGDMPEGLAVGDFNDDGIADLVVASSGSDIVSVLLGNGSAGVGDGTFAAAVSYAAGDGPTSVVTGDFDGDGIADLAAANRNSDNVSVLLGNGAGAGDGTFAAAINFAAGDRPESVATGDFDEDGIADLVVANGGSDNASVLLGNGSAGVGDGTFAAAVGYAAGDGPESVATGDFNGDGIADLAIASFDSYDVSVLLGNGGAGVGDGTFAAAVSYVTDYGPTNVMTGDFNEDGITDLATANWYQNSTSVLLGNGSGGVGDGTFAPRVNYGPGLKPNSLAKADFDGDGIVDLAIADSGGYTVSVLLGSGSAGVGDGTFAAADEYFADQVPWSVAKADFNGDDIADLVAANRGSDEVSVLLGNGSGGIGDGTFAAAVKYGAGDGPVSVTTGDFNGDGVADIATANEVSDSVSVLLGNGSGGVGDGTFATAVDYAVGDEPAGVATGDFDGDDIADLVAANRGSDNVSVLLGNGSGGVGDGTFAAAVGFAAGDAPFGVTTGDFDEDGITDLVTANRDSDDVSVLLGNGSGGVGDGTFAAPVVFGAGTGPQGVTTGDFDEDGIVDLAVANPYSYDVSVLLGNGSAGVGDGTFAAAVDYPVGDRLWCVATGDFNGDGIVDLATADEFAHGVSVLLGNGSGGTGDGTFSTAVQYLARSGCQSVVAGDFDEDGFDDLAIAHADFWSVTVLLNRGIDPRLVISEYMADPDNSSDADGEYFELFNPASGAVDIDGWTIRDDDGEAHVIDNGGPLSVPSRGYLVLGRSASAPHANDYVHGDDITLDEAGDEIVLEAAPGVVRVRLVYTTASTPGVAKSIDDIDGHPDGETTDAGYIDETSLLGNGDFGSPGGIGVSLPVEIDGFLVE